MGGSPKRVGRGTSPTQRTLKRLRDLGYLAEVVEHWNQHAKVRNDLFGFGDVIGLREGEVLLVQATSGDNVAARVRKAGIRIEVHGWRKLANGRYECRVVDCS